MDITTYALEPTVHFLLEERTDRPETKTWQSHVSGFPFTAQPYKKYGEGVLAEEKCTGDQEPLQGSQLCWMARGPHDERIHHGVRCGEVRKS